MTTITLDTLLETFSGSQEPIETRIDEFIQGFHGLSQTDYGDLESQGKKALEESRYLEAAALFSAAIEIIPTGPSAYYNLGVAWLNAARESLTEEQLHEEHGSTTHTSNKKRFLFFARDALVIAYNRSKTAPTTDEDKQKYLGSLFEAYAQLEDYSSILMEAVRLKDDEVENAETFCFIGLAYGYGRSDWKNAEKYLGLAKNQSAAQNNGKPDPVYLFRLAEAYAADGQTGSASLQLRMLNAALDEEAMKSCELDKLLVYHELAKKVHMALHYGMLQDPDNGSVGNPEYDGLKILVANLDKALEKQILVKLARAEDNSTT